MNWKFTLQGVLLVLLTQINAFAQPANDNFAAATDVTALINTCSGSAAYTTVAATADHAAGSCWSNGPNYNVWFKFTATATKYIKVDVNVGGGNGTLQNPFVAVWDASLVQLNCQNYQGAAVSIETDYYGLTAGQTYYISVDNYVGAGYRGTFTLCLSDVPDYNYFEGARDVTSLINTCSSSAAYSTVNATADRSAGSCWSNGPNYNRWFKFTATATQYIKVDVNISGANGTLQNPFVALWDASLTQLNCQNYQGALVSIETDYYGLTAGQTYYISVDNYVGAGYRGTFTLCLSDVVDYNYFEGARDVTSLINTCSASAAYSTANATADRSGGSCWSNGPNYNRWFKFTASATQYIKVDVNVGGANGTLQNPFVALWDASLTQLNCQNYQGASVSIETDYFGLTAGQTYYISVDNYAGNGYRGTFTLCLSDVVDYNFFEGARDVTSLINTCSASAAYSTVNATPDRSKGSCWSNGPNYNRWFKFTATATQYIKVDVNVGGANGTLQNPFVALWDASLTQLNCQNYQGASVSIETDYYGLTAGQTYYISVDNYGGLGYRGTFTLCLSDVVDYNFFEGARDVTSLINTCSASAAYSTVNATADRTAGSCWSNGPNYNRWFKFTATATQYIKIDVNVGGANGTLQNPFVALWDASLTQLNCQNYQGASVSIETDYYGLTAGQTYYISVDNYVGTGYRGTFTLCLSDVVDYNYFEGARDVTSLINTCSASAAYSTINATPDRSKGSCWSNGPNYNRWFKFTATATQYIKVDVNVGGANGTLQNPFVAIWDASLTQLNCQNYQGASVSIETDYFGLTAGQTYYISVDNYVGTGYRGTFTLCLSDAVDYNYWEGSMDVTSLINGCSANAAYTTVNATPDRSAGSCWSNGPNYNRWFRFTATTKYIKVTVNVGGASGTLQNPFVALWDASLTQLNCQNFQGASVSIETDYYGLSPGGSYYISVDNYVGAGYRGSFSLCITDLPDYNYYEGATNLTNLDNWCSANAAYTTLNATPDKNKGSCWSNGPNYNRWFKFTALSTSTTIQVKVGGVEGTMQNPFVALWASNGTTQLACTNYAGATTDISLSYGALTVANTYYISVDNYVGTGYRGTFTLCINNVDPTIFYSRADGSWNTPSTWSNVGYGGVAAATAPVAGSIVNIRDNLITVTSAGQCAELNITTSAAVTSLTIDNATLTVNGNVTVTNAANNSLTTTIQNNGIINIANDCSFTRSGGNSSTLFNLTSGSVSIGQDMNWISTNGTVSTNTLTASNASTLSVARDVNLNYSGGMKTSLNFNNTSSLSVGRDLSFTSTAASVEELIFNNSSTMSLKRNIVRGGTPYGTLTFNNSSTLTLNATGTQQVIAASAGSGGDAITYNNVTLNNTSGFATDFTMGGIATINGTLTMSQGLVQTTAPNYLALLNSSTTTIGNISSYVDGPMTYEVATSTANTVRNFPIGNNGSYRPLVLTVTHSSASSVIYTAQHFTSSAAALGYVLAPTTDKVSGARYWQVNSSNQANLTSANVTLYYGYGVGLSDGVSDLPNLTVVKTVGAGTTWVDIGKVSATPEPGNIVSGSFSSFCTFTLANLTGGTNSLPIKLLSFEGKSVLDGIELSWVTATELNNDYFEVEKSFSGSEFQSIIRVKGAGTKNTVSEYKAIDSNPTYGLAYYRLKQVDFDGRRTFSDVISVRSEAEYISLYPNPTRGESVKIRSSFVDEGATVEILNSMGTVIYSEVWKHLPVLNQTTTIDASQGLPAGLYFIRISGRNKSQTLKVIISN